METFLHNYLHNVASPNGRNKSARCISHVCCHVALSTCSANRKVLRGHSLPAISGPQVYKDFTSILKQNSSPKLSVTLHIYSASSAHFRCLGILGERKVEYRKMNFLGGWFFNAYFVLVSDRREYFLYSLM